MAFNHGSVAVVKLDNSSNALTDISQYVESADFSYEVDTVEVSTLGDTAKDYLAGLKDFTLSLSGPWDPTVDAIFAAALGAEKSLEYGPAGSTSGYVKYSGEVICTSYEVSAGVDGAAEYSAEFQGVRGVTRGTWA